MVAATGVLVAVGSYILNLRVSQKNKELSLKAQQQTRARVCMFLWEKFKLIIEKNRRRYNGQSYLRDLEYLYDEMMKWKLSKDPSYRVPDTLDKYVPSK